MKAKFDANFRKRSLLSGEAAGSIKKSFDILYRNVTLVTKLLHKKEGAMQFRGLPLRLLKSPHKLKIVKFLLNHEAAMSEREMASVVGVSHMSVNRTLQELAEMNLVYSVNVGKAHVWKVNSKSYLFGVLRRLIRALEVIPDPLEELKQTILKNLPLERIEKVVLFGSVAQKKERVHSDIDLFILVKNPRDRQKIEQSVENLSSRCLELFGNRLSPYILTRQQYQKKKTLDVIVEIDKGISIYPNGKNGV